MYFGIDQSMTQTTNPINHFIQVVTQNQGRKMQVINAHKNYCVTGHNHAGSNTVTIGFKRIKWQQNLPVQLLNTQDDNILSSHLGSILSVFHNKLCLLLVFKLFKRRRNNLHYSFMCSYCGQFRSPNIFSQKISTIRMIYVCKV